MIAREVRVNENSDIARELDTWLVRVVGSSRSSNLWSNFSRGSFISKCSLLPNVRNTREGEEYISSDSDIRSPRLNVGTSGYRTSVRLWCCNNKLYSLAIIFWTRQEEFVIFSQFRTSRNVAFKYLLVSTKKQYYGNRFIFGRRYTRRTKMKFGFFLELNIQLFTVKFDGTRNQIRFVDTRTESVNRAWFEAKLISKIYTNYTPDGIEWPLKTSLPSCNHSESSQAQLLLLRRVVG